MTGPPAASRPRRTAPAVEQAVAMLLGADDASARAAVAALVAAGRLGDGIALHALLLASRKGTDAAGAVALLAAGEEPATGWSSYEHRLAGEELSDEVALPRVTAGDGPSVTAAGGDGPVRVLQALRQGAGTVVVDRAALGEVTPGCAADFVAGLAARAGARVVVREGSADVSDAHTPDTSQADAVDGTVECGEDYLDVLEAG